MDWRPLYDMRFAPREPLSAILSVAGGEGEQRHSLGVPRWFRIEDAVQVAKKRGWRVIGVWKGKSSKALPKP